MTGPSSRRQGRAGTTWAALSAAVILALSGCAGTGPSTEGGGDAGSPGVNDDAVVTTEEPTADESSPQDPTQEAHPEDEQSGGEQSDDEQSDDEQATEESSREESPAPSEPDDAPSPEDTLDASPPASFSIDSIGAGSELLHLGLREDDTLEVPPGDPGSPASWFTGSPTPGEAGPSVLLGHVDDSAGDPGVFADLPQLEPGDSIEVTREDGSEVVFEVTKAEQYGKDDFPTLQVYGNTEGPELRLITCDGYNPDTGEYEDNYVVYAEISSSEQP
ncbi:MAG TPA: class F sortase [Candidatus Nesterenkonia stercoripullorum]|uniref:Class F sortase n=1 Tax=Candidatus Nesterenkonia stercoripullorum TaxID=2838701 RepID=A0A9D1URA0_9MICC|nr:class F sortase [Candidatus Nesterenkonia stercoripullorum]